jgi:high-affinity iron transporter
MTQSAPDSPAAAPAQSRRALARRLAPWGLAVAALALLVGLTWSSSGGTPDPTDTSNQLSHGAVVLDSAILVLREGLECILVLAAVTASFRGATSGYRKPVALGGVVALAASVATWFVAVAITTAVGPGSLDLQAGTGLLAIAVLLVVMNWFFHKVYWTGWISHHHQRRKQIVADAATGTTTLQKTVLGLALLGFTSVYREGFEIVLFLQNLRLRYGAGVVLEGVALGLACTAVLGFATFKLHAKLPYKRMLVATGVLLGVVLLVMVGEQVFEMQQAGWIGTSSIGVGFPGWMGMWFSIFPNWETIGAQLVAAVLVVGSYVMAEQMKVKRPRRQRQRQAAAATAAGVTGATPHAAASNAG